MFFGSKTSVHRLSMFISRGRKFSFEHKSGGEEKKFSSSFYYFCAESSENFRKSDDEGFSNLMRKLSYNKLRQINAKLSNNVDNDN
jgi:hypothetical protein